MSIGEWLMKIGVVIGAVLLVLNWGVIGYSPSVGTMMLFDSSAVQAFAFCVAGITLVGLILYVRMEHGNE